MPAETDRCARHPASPAIARCDGCGESLCLTCAVPVRGRVLGPRCLEVELGDPPAPPEAASAGHEPLRVVVDAALAAALLATILPWSGVGLGAGPFGAWGTDDPRWASVAVVGALAGCAAAATRALGARERGTVDRVAAAASALVVAGSFLAVLSPPPYTTGAAGPWVCLAAAIVALAAAVALRRRSVR